MQYIDQVLILGGIVIDHYMLVDQFPQRGQDIEIKDAFQKVGGCTINVGCTLKNLGCEPYMISKIGDDLGGKTIIRYLEDHQFKTECIKILPGEKTGYSLVFVEKSGERTFLTYKGIEGVFSRDLIPEEIFSQIKFAYLTGYYLLASSFHYELLDILEKLKKAGIKLMFDPGPLVGDIDDSMLLSALKITDVVVPNQEEVDIICRKLNIHGSFPVWCLDQGIKLVVVKKGEQGVEAWEEARHYFIAPFKVKSIDTTGAGDSFAGGLIYSLLHGDDMETALKTAGACGALTTTFMGPHGNFGINDVQLLIQGEREY